MARGPVWLRRFLAGVRIVRRTPMTWADVVEMVSWLSVEDEIRAEEAELAELEHGG